jgi:hypothetical protein
LYSGRGAVLSGRALIAVGKALKGLAKAIKLKAVGLPGGGHALAIGIKKSPLISKLKEIFRIFNPKNMLKTFTPAKRANLKSQNRENARNIDPALKSGDLIQAKNLTDKAIAGQRALADNRLANVLEAIDLAGDLLVDCPWDDQAAGAVSLIPGSGIVQSILALTRVTDFRFIWEPAVVKIDPGAAKDAKDYEELKRLINDAKANGNTSLAKSLIANMFSNLPSKSNPEYNLPLATVLRKHTDVQGQVIPSREWYQWSVTQQRIPDFYAFTPAQWSMFGKSGGIGGQVSGALQTMAEVGKLAYGVPSATMPLDQSITLLSNVGVKLNGTENDNAVAQIFGTLSTSS